MDLTATPEATINFPGATNSFNPPCIRIAAGATVTFNPGGQGFGSHPLVGGTIVNGVEVPDPTSPIPPTSSGNMALDVVFPNAGSFGYYCSAHAPSMAGAIFVE